MAEGCRARVEGLTESSSSMVGVAVRGRVSNVVKTVEKCTPWWNVREGRGVMGRTQDVVAMFKVEGRGVVMGCSRGVCALSCQNTVEEWGGGWVRDAHLFIF